ncbi:hypothetical protein CHLRE_06g260776v5 [Chlamydomonas reinhardtii]|uniref:Uncharacterized protein n=1 Tax=Chlamydomonas reinhardtii TaxID=3055 RepID=A0A2K3DMN3_CHLRE|nr:uncharacterized protein CHLRE_06g260776v5 [Chlamydomonas reinhardtii]PNW81799.1 hypothetical protein CHLRE_06g260776v5 [Chlamydomonas reinhardtii]
MTYLDPLTLGRIAANAQNATAREALLACGVQLLALLLLALLHGRLWRVPPMPSRPLQQQALLRTAEALLQHPVHCHCFRRKAHDKRASVSLASFRMAVDGETDASLSLTAGDLAAVQELLSELDLHIERVRGSQQVVLDAFMWFTNPGGNHEWHTDGVRSAPSSYEQQLRVTIPLVGRYDVLFRCPVGQHVGLSTSPTSGYAMDMVASGAHAATCLIDGSSVSMHLQHCVAPVQQLTCCVIVDYAGPVGPCSTSNQLQPLEPTPLVPTPLLPTPLVPAEVDMVSLPLSLASAPNRYQWLALIWATMYKAVCADDALGGGPHYATPAQHMSVKASYVYKLQQAWAAHNSGQQLSPQQQQLLESHPSHQLQQAWAAHNSGQQLSPQQQQLLESDPFHQLQQAWAAHNSGQQLSPQQQQLLESNPSHQLQQAAATQHPTQEQRQLLQQQSAWASKGASKGGTKARDRRNAARDPDAGAQVLVALQQAWHRVADQQPVGCRLFSEDQARLLKAAYSEWSSLEGRRIPMNHVWSNAVAQLTGIKLESLSSWRARNGC